MKSDYPLQTERHIENNCDFTPSNSRIISWAQGLIKKIKRDLRRVTKIIKSMKARKARQNKIYRGHEILNDYNDFNRINTDEDNEDWRNRITKEVQKLLEYEFSNSYPKD